MSEETNPEVERLKASLRAVSAERDRYKAENDTLRNAMVEVQRCAVSTAVRMIVNIALAEIEEATDG